MITRRRKNKVLNLPPITEMIVPVTMTVLQKTLYREVLEKNVELIKSLKAGADSKKIALNNTFMQLRKVLCHPYVYENKFEDRSLEPGVMMREFINAGAKYRLLEKMLPELRKRGHRVLIFSQFLDNLDCMEDFLAILDLPCTRLDGKHNALEKQRRIDLFNKKDSELFAFLLSTRAGGVGINLATADTVIIMVSFQVLCCE